MLLEANSTMFSAGCKQLSGHSFRIAYTYTCYKKGTCEGYYSFDATEVLFAFRTYFEYHFSISHFTSPVQ